MVYIKNKKHYAVKFTAKIGGVDKTFGFGCFVRFKDTGNIADTGVTAIEDAEYNALVKECPAFSRFITDGYLVKTKKAGAVAVADKVNSLARENEELKKQIAKKNKELVAPKTDADKAKDAEIVSLKAQLEKLAKPSKKDSKAKADTVKKDDESF